MSPLSLQGLPTDYIPQFPTIRSQRLDVPINVLGTGLEPEDIARNVLEMVVFRDFVW